MSRLKTLVVAGAAVAATACSDFLSGDKLDFDPNRPTSAEAAQLLTAVQVNSYYILNGHAARVLAMWMQQMAGTDRQYRGYDQYSITEGLFGEYSSAYTGGGLIDMRAIQADAEASGTQTDYTGIDPESNLGGATASRGNEYFNNPQSRSFVLSFAFNR